MPEEAARWDNSTRKEDPATLWEDSSDEYEEEHNTWNRGLGSHATRKQSQNTAVHERGRSVQDRTDVPLRAGRHLHVHGVVKRKRKRRAGIATGRGAPKRRVKRAKHADGSPRTLEHGAGRVSSHERMEC